MRRRKKSLLYSNKILPWQVTACSSLDPQEASLGKRLWAEPSEKRSVFFLLKLCHCGKVTHRAGPGSAREASICVQPVLVALQVPAAAPQGAAAVEMELLWYSDVLGSQRNSNGFFGAQAERVLLRVSRMCSFACRDSHPCSLHPFTAGDEEDTRKLWGHGLPLPYTTLPEKYLVCVSQLCSKCGLGQGTGLKCCEANFASKELIAQLWSRRKHG